MDIPARRDARVDKKSRLLCRKKSPELYPHLPLQARIRLGRNVSPRPKDGLPFFGPHPQHGPRVHFAMAYGGNGITYSMLGAGLLRVADREDASIHWHALFSFDRLER